MVFSRQRLRRTLYGLLPLIWGLLLARHLPLGMGEAGQLLPVSLSALEGTWIQSMPSWQADAHVIVFCQSLVVLLGWASSVVLLRRHFGANAAG